MRATAAMFVVPLKEALRAHDGDRVAALAQDPKVQHEAAVLASRFNQEIGVARRELEQLGPKVREAEMILKARRERELERDDDEGRGR